MKRQFNLADLFELVASEVGDREALVCGDARLSYRELDERSTRLADSLSRQGIKERDHVGLYLYNCNEYLEAMLACFKLRAVPININYRYVEEELLYVFKNADLVGLIHGREFIPRIKALQDSAPMAVLVVVEDGSDEADGGLKLLPYEQAVAEGSPQWQKPERSGDDWFILYTGGTTGMPKGVIWPHEALLFGALGGLGHSHPDGPVRTPEEVGSRARDNFPMISMPLAPLMHGACWWSSCISLLSGHKVVLNPNRSLDGEQIWDIAARERVNSISLVGDAMAMPLLDALLKFPGRWDLECLMVVGSGGAVFSDAVQAKLVELFPKLLLFNSFGSSETGFQGGDTGRKSDGIGRIMRGEHADVITPDQRFVTPGSGEQGYLARSGHVPVGYYNSPKETAASFITIDGKSWVLTGDLCTVDEDGSIIVYGRGSNCINSGGEKIFPEEVELAIKNHPAVFDSLVVGTPDPRFTERVAAVVQLRQGTSLGLEEWQQECRRHISGYKIPRELHITDHISRSPSGKPDYRWARKVVTDGRHRATG